MITKTLLIAALSVLAAGSVLADEVTPHPTATYNSTLTRAEVQAEYVRAKQAGEINHGYESAFPQRHVASTLTRAEVTAEYLRAKAAGELRHAYESVWTAPSMASTLTRAEVTAEVVRARKAGELALDHTAFGSFGAARAVQ